MSVRWGSLELEQIAAEESSSAALVESMLDGEEMSKKLVSDQIVHER